MLRSWTSSTFKSIEPPWLRGLFDWKDRDPLRHGAGNRPEVEEQPGAQQSAVHVQEEHHARMTDRKPVQFARFYESARSINELSHRRRAMFLPSVPPQSRIDQRCSYVPNDRDELERGTQPLQSVGCLH